MWVLAVFGYKLHEERAKEEEEETGGKKNERWKERERE